MKKAEWNSLQHRSHKKETLSKASAMRSLSCHSSFCFPGAAATVPSLTEEKILFYKEVFASLVDLETLITSGEWTLGAATWSFLQHLL